MLSLADGAVVSFQALRQWLVSHLQMVTCQWFSSCYSTGEMNFCVRLYQKETYAWLPPACQENTVLTERNYLHNQMRKYVQPYHEVLSCKHTLTSVLGSSVFQHVASSIMSCKDIILLNICNFADINVNIRLFLNKIKLLNELKQFFRILFVG